MGVDLDTLFANCGMAAGPFRIATLENFGGEPERSVEETENDIIIWLESMLTQQSHEIGGKSSKVGGAECLAHIIRQM